MGRGAGGELRAAAEHREEHSEEQCLPANESNNTASGHQIGLCQTTVRERDMCTMPVTEVLLYI